MRLIIGVDEVGRGPLAGPVVAAAVALSAEFCDSRIKDSKLLSRRNREQLFPIITSNSAAWSVVAVGHHRIEQLNILNASLLAMRLACSRVLSSLKEDVEIILVDGNKEIPFAPSDSQIPPQRAVVHGDRLCPQIAAASILAKVSRDAQMAVLERKYPGYGFNAHAGYPTKAHREAIKQIGPSPVHRRSFSGVAEYLEA